MVKESRTAIYDFLKPLFTSVSQNIYPQRVPTDNTSDDTENGFIVIEVGDIRDESEFDLQTFGWVRCSVVAYIPQKTRGRWDEPKYKVFESGINTAVRNAIDNPDRTSPYAIQSDGILSSEDIEDTQKGNQYSVYIKSFIVTIDG